MLLGHGFSGLGFRVLCTNSKFCDTGVDLRRQAAECARACENAAANVAATLARTRGLRFGFRL